MRSLLLYIINVAYEQYAQADVAQLVAHLIGSEEVTGSIPVVSFGEEMP